MCLFLLVLLICLPAASIFSQKETNNWYFGFKAGLNFNSGVPLFSKGEMDTWEGCATISDKNGNLLFYTDGRYVWNRNHQLMPNGSGLYGDYSSTQSGVIVPFVDNDSLYYVFTVDEEAGPRGLQYSIVNLKLQNGLGDVSQKNIPLLAPTLEKVTAVKHSNNHDIWVISHKYDSDEFYAYLITSAGLNTNPVISKSGSVVNGISFDGNSIGYLKFSPDGRKLGMASFMTFFELFDFDAATGMVSNPKRIQSAKTGLCGPYGVEFSCNSELMYISESYSCNGAGQYAIFQLDISSGNETEIENSRVKIDEGTIHAAGALQLGPDNRIYIAFNGADYIGTINKPKVKGAGCDYVRQSIPLNGATSGFGLPSFIQSYFSFRSDIQTAGNCGLFQVSFQLSNPGFIDSVRWNFGDPSSGSLNTSGDLEPVHTFTSAGAYPVTAVVYRGCFNDTARKLITTGVVQQTFLGADTTLCAGTQYVLRPSITGTAYRWQDGSLKDNFVVTGPGTYWVSITQGACTVSDTIHIAYTTNTFNIILVPDTVVMAGTTLMLQAGGGIKYQWEPSAGLSDPNIPNPTVTVIKDISYVVRVTSVNGCTASDTINIKAIMDGFNIFVPNIFTPNSDGLNDRFRPVLTGYRLRTFIVYNRYGEKVFETSEQGKGWDGRIGGKLQGSSVYVWMLIAKTPDGTEVSRKGTVALIR